MTTEANRKIWSDKAKGYSKAPGAERIFAQVTENLTSQAHWFGLSRENRHNTKILDYACGPGTAGLALREYAATIVGVDSAPGMIEQFNQRVGDLKLDSKDVFALQGDLLSDAPPPDLQPLYGLFDLVVVSLGFHHFDHPTTAIAQLIKPLRSGGKLVIIDFLKHNNFQDATDDVQKTIGHGGQTGFSEEDIVNHFEQGGCHDVAVRPWRAEADGGQGDIVFEKGDKVLRFKVFTCCGTA